ncbi:hypothetical protein [Robertmurraya siralis]|uniref:hypothetical protein n=1 Tax=Robertmurraya siralis TaxID=77777 RepID=UPI0010F4F396|nr:hypothetical protein [Robertmurraya siralis]
MQDEKIIESTENTILLTAEKYEREILEKAVYDYNNNSNFRSVQLNEGSGLINFKIEDIDNLAYNAQGNLNNILKINSIIRLFVNKNDILGNIYESIESNINSDWVLNYPKHKEMDEETLKFVDEIIRDFNEKINLGELISESIPMTYLEGNYPMYLRKDTKNNNYQIDYYPLGVCEVSDYSDGNEPYLLINVKELEARLRKTYKKNRKNQPLFYANAEEEVKATYPIEVYEAFKNKEAYAKLNIQNTGLMRINNLKRKYGLSHIFKALKPVVRLENIELSEDKNTLVRGKKILFQKLSKELFIESNANKSKVNWSEAIAKAHTDLITALNSSGNLSVFTGLPWTESLDYIEPSIEPTNVQVKNNYRNQILTAVGIQYLSADKGSLGAAQISINELLKVINKIGEQLEKILVKWYKGILIDHGIDPKIYCPKIKVLDSEKLNIELSMQLARMLNNELNASLETVFNTLGLDVKNEARKRANEREMGYEEIFTPRQTAHTNSGGNDSKETGRPNDSDNTDKQDYDKDYNKNNNR